MKKIIFLVISLSAIKLISCSSFAYERVLNGKYYLLATDVYEDMSIGVVENGVGIGVINSSIFSVGQNDSFIIVKQHPRFFPNAPNKKITNYYIIPLKNKISNSSDKNFWGPLSEREFNIKRGQLLINNLDFSIIFNELK